MKKLLLASLVLLSFLTPLFSQSVVKGSGGKHPLGKGSFSAVNTDPTEWINGEIKRIDMNIPLHRTSLGLIDKRTTILKASARPELARDLPMTPKGNLQSVDGGEVYFNVPNNPNDPGICKTPVPTVVLSSESAEKVMANCPFVVPCDNPTNRDATPIPTSPNFVFFKLNWIVVRDAGGNPASNIDQTRVDDLMAEVNADFAPFGVQFCADPATFVNDGTHYNLNVGTEDASLKTTHGTNPTDHINVYVVNDITNPSAGGYARFPYDPFGGTNIRGGVVLAQGNMFLGTHTLAHELGHTFGLHHTFHGVDEVTPCTNCYEGNDNSPSAGQSIGGDTEGDWCQDTPPHPTNSYICGDAGTDACAPFNAWQNSPVDNHMSYSFCTSTFTTQQARRMHCMINSYLASWVAFGGSTCGTQPPVANFVGNPTYAIAPGLVTFTDLSLPASTITNWQWNFDVTNVGAGSVTPATFVGQTPPQVSYPNPGLYTVQLIVTNANGSDTVVATDYIEIVSPPSGGQCDTLDQLFTPNPPGFTIYSYAAGDLLTGVPNAEGYRGFYERYFTTGTNYEIGEIVFIAGNAVNNSGNLAANFGVYPDDAGNPGFPDVNNPIYESATFAPDTVFPGAGLGAISLTFCPPLNVGAINNFHVGIEITNGTILTGQVGADTFIVASTPNGFGQSASLNTQICPACVVPPNPPNLWNRYGASQWGAGTNLDFDLGYLPIMGPSPNDPFLGTILGAVFCDTTAILYPVFAGCDLPTVWEIEFGNGLVFTDTSYAAIDSFVVFHTDQAPVSLEIRTDNICGRKDTAAYNITYPLDTVPNMDFTKPAGPHCAGTAVNFTATPAGLPQYDWDFGDGTTTTTVGNTTSHTYATPGLYYVTVNGTSSLGNCLGTETKLDYVEVIDCSVNPPAAGFTQNPDTGCAPLLVTFTDTSLALPDPATSWLWSFDDGNFSVSQNPSHQFDSIGVYNVMLVASNAGGADTAFFTINVNSLCILPYDVRLHGTAFDEEVLLNWELNPDASHLEMVLERAEDGANFNEIARFSPSTKQLHNFVDRPGIMGRPLQYRLRMIDSDGSQDYTNVVEVILGQSDEWLQVYPNPVNGGVSFNVDTYLNQSGLIVYGLYDLMGKQLLGKAVEGNIGLNRLSVPTDQLPKGAYALKVAGPYGVKTVKVIVE